MVLAKRKKTKSVLKVGGKCASDTSQCLTCSLAVCACAVERETADMLRAHPGHGGFPEPSRTPLSLYVSAAEPSHVLSLRNCTLSIPLINLSLHLMS